MRYARCRTCGKYLDPSSALRKLYCGETCAARFVRCANCGGYFPTGGGYGEEICSQACSIRYIIHRSRGILQAEDTGEEAT